MDRPKKRDRLADLELAYNSQYYAEGGDVHLPNLPSKGVPQSGPMHYGSDEEGFAEGGFLRWIKNLSSHATDAERSAIADVRGHARVTGNEKLILGNRFAPNRISTLGDYRSAPLPENYDDWIRQGADAPIFSAHSHPQGSTAPSAGDINVWSNNLSQLAFQDPTHFSRQAMWIAGTKGPSDLSVMEPVGKGAEARWNAIGPALDTHMRRDMSHSNAAKLWDHWHDFTNNKYLFQPTDIRQEAARMYEQGVLADRLSQHLPLHFDPDTPISTMPGETGTIGEVWPEWLNYLRSKDSMPYAEGGKVDGFAEGGLFKGLREYIRGYSEPIKAWHGSPHDFEKFDASKIGTGEGAQIYGHGLYFAENPSVAKFYRESLAGMPEPWQLRLNGEPIFDKGADLSRFPADIQRGAVELHGRLGIYKNPADPDILARTKESLERTLANAQQAKEEGRAFWSQDLQKLDNPRLTGPYKWNDWDDWSVLNNQNALDLLNHPEFSVTPGHTPGRLYGVDIHEDPENFLSLDKSFAAQDEVGKRSFDALSKIDSALRRNPDSFFYGKPADVPSLDDPRFSTQALWNDIPGTRYLDAMSRNKGVGTSNYVVFPGAEDIVDITGKYAEGGKVGDEQKRRWLLYAGFLNDGT